MSSLQSCVKKCAPPERQEEILSALRDMLDGHLKDNAPGIEAKKMAVDDILKELKEERSKIVAQILKEKSNDQGRGNVVEGARPDQGVPFGSQAPVGGM